MSSSATRTSDFRRTGGARWRHGGIDPAPADASTGRVAGANVQVSVVLASLGSGTAGGALAPVGRLAAAVHGCLAPRPGSSVGGLRS